MEAEDKVFTCLLCKMKLDSLSEKKTHKKKGYKKKKGKELLYLIYAENIMRSCQTSPLAYSKDPLAS